MFSGLQSLSGPTFSREVSSLGAWVPFVIASGRKKGASSDPRMIVEPTPRYLSHQDQPFELN